MSKVCLIILDGFGIGEDDNKTNATLVAENIEIMKKHHHYYKAKAHGKYVGLPENAMGNSEVGHMTIGSGRVIKQPVLMINEAWNQGLFKRRMDQLYEEFTGSIHLIGLLSDGGIHSHVDHLRYFLSYFESKNRETFIHAISDGRDTEPKRFKKWLSEFGNIVSVSGRYYTMDRDNNTERIDKAFYMMINGVITPFDIDKIYDDGNSDEFIEPILIKDKKIKHNDTLIFFNFRADRMKQIVKRFENYGKRFTLTDYGVENITVLFEKPNIKNTLPEWLAKNGIRQTHIAESEKYAHVTYFFNGGKSDKYKMETRIMVESPKISTFDLKPETASYDVANSCIDTIKNGEQFIVVNFASPDLVGHTGNFASTCRAISIVDSLVFKIYLECIARNYVLILTADHGNSERMKSKNQICKTHTTSDVPLIIINSKKLLITREIVTLSDIAPTILDFFDIDKPEEMSGISLVDKT